MTGTILINFRVTSEMREAIKAYTRCHGSGSMNETIIQLLRNTFDRTIDELIAMRDSEDEALEEHCKETVAKSRPFIKAYEQLYNAGSNRKWRFDKA